MANEDNSFFDYIKAFIVVTAVVALKSAQDAGKNKSPTVASLVPLKQATPPTTVLVGDWARVSGAYSYWKAADRYMGCVYLLNDGRGEFDEIYVSDDAVSLDGDPYDGSGSDDGWVTAVTNTAGLNNDGRYVDEKLRINLRRGLATETCYTRMVEFFGPGAIYDITDYTTSFRGDGTMTAMAFHQSPTDTAFFRQAFPNGRPTESFGVRGVFYDWRHDSTVGGTLSPGTQRRGDESTWQPCSNPVVNLVHLEWFRWGRSWDRCIAPVLADLTAEADYCDERVDLHAGSDEARYSVAGWYTSDTQRDEVRQKVLATMDGFYTIDGQGRLIIKAGRYDAPTYVLTARHIEGFDWTRGVPSEGDFNELSITFTSKANDYNQVECDPWIVGDGGKVQTLPLDWVPSFTQARRLAKRKMARMRPARQGQIKTGPYGLNGLGERYIRVQNPRRTSMADVVCEVVNAEFDPMTGQFIFDVIQADVDIDDWDPATEEGAAVPVPVRP